MRNACRSVVLTVALSMVATAGSACDATAPDISAQREGDDVRLTWVGTLGPGDTWTVLEGSGYPVDIPAMVPVTTTTANETLTTGVATDLDGHAWAVRCEGAMGAGPMSELAFQLVRDLTTVLPPPPFFPFRNLFYISLPVRLGLPDVANTADPNPCAPAAGVDGIVNADDLLCAWFTSGRGTLTLSRWDNETARFQTRAILYEEFALEGSPGVVLAGDWTAPLVPGEAVRAFTCASDTSGPVTDLAVIVGAHDAAAPCQVLEIPLSNARPNTPLLNVPYHSLLRNSLEILCGREGIDWMDADSDGVPDRCNNGIFDSVTGAGIIVETFDNVRDMNGTDNSFVIGSIYNDELFDALVLSGPTFALVPGEAYPVILDHDLIPPEHSRTDFCPPTAR